MNIILGQFYPTGSFLEKIDARAKIISTIIYIISVFLCDSFISYGLCIAALVFAATASKLPFGMLISGMKGMLVILLFTAVINLFFTDEGNVILSFWIIKITDESILRTIKLCLRLVLLVMSSSILTLTTKPVQLTVALESIMKPFGRIGLPYHEIAMMMSIALRFIPTLMEELVKIKKAQQARGASFDEGGFYARIKAFVPIIIPLFVSSFRRADELAMAMEARCYRGGINRTRLNNPKFGIKDYCIIIILFLFTFLIAVLEYMI